MRTVICALKHRCRAASKPVVTHGSPRHDNWNVHLRIRRLLASSIVVVPMLLSAALPAPSGYVNDFASVLDDSAEQYLEGFLETLERDTTAEVVVATVASLDGMTVEEYANR